MVGTSQRVMSITVTGENECPFTIQVAIKVAIFIAWLYIHLHSFITGVSVNKQAAQLHSKYILHLPKAYRYVVGNWCP